MLLLVLLVVDSLCRPLQSQSAQSRPQQMKQTDLDRIHPNESLVAVSVSAMGASEGDRRLGLAQYYGKLHQSQSEVLPLSIQNIEVEK